MRDLNARTKDLLAAFRESGYCTDCWVNLNEEEHDDKCPERGRVVSAQGWVACSNCGGSGIVEPPISGTDPDGRFASAPCPDCVDGDAPSEAMVEAAARATQEIDRGTRENPREDWRSLGEIQDFYRVLARAALFAARRYEEGQT